MLRFLIFSSLISTTVYSITCTSCEFKLLPPHSTNCEDTCEGDVCFIVVNKYFNGTINAGCMYLREGDEFNNKSVCQRLPYDNRCACNTGDRCNDPKVKLFTYKFTEEPVLVDYQWLPQIQPPQPTFQPIEEILNPQNVTDIDKNKENETMILRNEDEFTVTTSVGLNIREKAEDVPIVTETTTATLPTVKPTRVIGSVEMTKTNEEATPTFATSSSSKNTIITSDSKTVPDSSNSLSSLLISTFVVVFSIAIFRF